MFRAGSIAALLLLIGATVTPSPAGACLVANDSDPLKHVKAVVRRHAEVVLIGRVESVTHIVDPERRRVSEAFLRSLGERPDLDEGRRQQIINRTDRTILDLEVEEVLVGQVPSRITVAAFPIGLLPDSRRVLLALRSVGAGQHSPVDMIRIEGGPALSVISIPCRGAIMLDADGPLAAAVRSMLATSSLSRWGLVGLVLGIGTLAASPLIRRKPA